MHDPSGLYRAPCFSDDEHYYDVRDVFHVVRPLYEFLNYILSMFLRPSLFPYSYSLFSARSFVS